MTLLKTSLDATLHLCFYLLFLVKLFISKKVIISVIINKIILCIVIISILVVPYQEVGFKSTVKFHPYSDCPCDYPSD
jgi:hypothetical protein